MTNVVQRVKSAVRRAIGRTPRKSADFYKGGDFLKGYVAHTEWRVAQDPKEAVGGLWDEMGELQFAFLRGQGLQPVDRMLDLGCGTLRGGRRFIAYLDRGNYTGVDISPGCITAAKKLVEDEGLAAKAPALLLNETGRMAFREFGGATFDYILAQSVFTHLPPEPIRECFAHIGNAMAPNGRFYFTYWRKDAETRFDIKEFGYPFAFFEALAAENGFVAAELSQDYRHPRDQKMGIIARASVRRSLP